MMVGLILRQAPLGLTDAIVKHGGSILWAAMIYWIVSTLRGHWSPGQDVLAAMVIAFGIEGSQLYHQPLLDAFRATHGGALLLGRVFSIRDLMAYGLGIVLTGVADHVIRSRQPDR